MKALQIQKLFLHIALLVVAASALGEPSPQLKINQPDQVTVPLHVEGNRVSIDLTLQRADGSTRLARFWVDTGGGAFIITESLARDLGIKWGDTEREGDSELGHVSVAPTASVGKMSLSLDPREVAVSVGKDNLLPSAAPGHADGFFPGRLLARYHVVFDYPKATFTLARPGVLKPQGNALPMPVSKETGFPRTEIEVDGVTYGFLIDTGASFTIVSEALLKSWGNKHPDWPRHPGAVGDAATLGGSTLETMSIPKARWGQNTLSELGVTSQKEGTFERWMSSMTKGPVVGALAGNVLKRFRLDLDYANETLYLSTP